MSWPTYGKYVGKSPVPLCMDLYLSDGGHGQFLKYIKIDKYLAKNNKDDIRSYINKTEEANLDFLGLHLPMVAATW